MSDVSTPAETPSETPLNAVSEAVGAHCSQIEHWDAVVSRWLDGHIASSPVTRATDAYKHLVAALPALRQALEETMSCS